MPVDIDKILDFKGNKYEITDAMIKYARHLTQKYDGDIDIPVNRNTLEKVTVVAINDILSGKVSFTFDHTSEEENLSPAYNQPGKKNYKL